MAADPPPADYAVSRTDLDGGTSVIYTCSAHLVHTKRVMQAGLFALTVTPADPARHGCKGHLEAWPRL